MQKVQHRSVLQQRVPEGSMGRISVCISHWHGTWSTESFPTGSKPTSAATNVLCQALGFSSAGSFQEALMKFVNAHMYAFHNLVKVHAIEEAGNTDWLQNPPKLLLYQLEVDRSQG